MSTLIVLGSASAQAGIGMRVLSAYGGGLVACAPALGITATVATRVAAIRETPRRRRSMGANPSRLLDTLTHSSPSVPAHPEKLLGLRAHPYSSRLVSQGKVGKDS